MIDEENMQRISTTKKYLNFIEITEFLDGTFFAEICGKVVYMRIANDNWLLGFKWRSK